MSDATPRPLTEELLAQASWLSTLAQRLVGAGPRADDAVQETWLSALEGPGPRDGFARPWLAQVLRNVLLKDARENGARKAREKSLPLPKCTPATSDAVARAEGQEALVAAVLKLEEPLRTTVLQRYFDGLSSAAIAEEFGIPASTVRNRLRRALHQLRSGLDPEERSGLLALAGLTLHALPKTASSAAPATLLAGTILMTAATKTALSLGLTVVLLAGAWITLGPGTKELQPKGVSMRSNPAQGVADLADVKTRGIRTAPEEVGSAPPVESIAQVTEPGPDVQVPSTPLLPGQLEVLVLLDGVPVSSGTAHVYDGGFNAFPRDLSKDRKGMHHALIDADGWARFQGIPRGLQNVAVEVEPGYCQYTQPTLSSEVGMRLVIPMESAGIAGRVTDELGSPVEGASVFLDGPAEGLQCTTWTDVEGRYSLRGMPEGEVEVTMIPTGGHWFPAGGEKRALTVAAGRVATLNFGPEKAWPRWTGVVRNAAGEVMSVGRPPIYRGALILRDVSRGLVRRVQITDDGRIDIGMAPGTYEVAIKVGSEEKHPILEDALVMPNQNLQHDLTVPGAIVRGQIREDGAGYDQGSHQNQSVSLYDLRSPPGPAEYAASIDQEGHFVVSGVAPGTYKVLTYPRKIPEGTELKVLEGDTELLLNVDLIPVRRR